MKAVVKQKRGDGFVDLAEAPEPQCAEGEMLVRVGYAGICGSDIMMLHDRFPSYNPPVIMGHEFAGTVESLGSGVSGFSVGDRVACETHAYVCGECGYCRSGLYNLCPDRKGFGYGVDGAFARFVSVRKGIVHHLPDEIQDREAAVLEPLSVAVNALTRNSRIIAGESVLVIGPGPIGLLCLQLGRLGGSAVTVVGTEHSRVRLSAASKMGAESVMTDTELKEELAAGRLSDSFDSVVITTGEPSSFETALKAARRNGRVVHIGESTDRASFQFSLLERKNLTVQGSFSHNWPVWEAAISLVKEGRVDLLSLVTHEVGISDWKEAFRLTESREGMKVLIRP
ncbi:MAG: alcohol dehydrogenase catalytic domain-containing protein [Nitrososphaerota archaeon]|nr:alcohol dehydrogenase catalytic domain-containing protein [Nitrososphaerota archaeon]